MAGDWIKVEHALPDKPEVMAIAAALGIDPDAVVGKLLRVWAWFDNHSADGNAPVTVRALLDRHAGVTGFVAAMLTVGWLTESNGRLNVGKFERHNGKTAKVRALGRNRTQSARAKCNGDSVTNPLQVRDQRREEKSILTLTSKNKSRGSLEELRAFAVSLGLPASDGESMFDHWEANGWKNGSSPSKDWQAGIRKWKSQGWLPSQKVNGAAVKPRIVPDIGGRKPSSIANWDNAPPPVHREDDKIEF